VRDPCAYCGEECDDSRRFCEMCWGDLPGELQDRVVATYPEGGDRFQNAVEGAIKFLVWADEQEEEPECDVE
jgi:hypothetical protein